MITWACVKVGNAETRSIVRTRPSIPDEWRDRMVKSIPDPAGSAKTILAFQHLDALCAVGREAITGRLHKKFVQQGPQRVKTGDVPSGVR